MSDMPGEQLPARSLHRALANDADPSVTSALDSPAIPNQQILEGGDSGNGTDVILSMKDERYKTLMWEQFNILGRARDIPREENVALVLWTQFMKEGARFYRLERDGERIHLPGEVALERELFFICYACMLTFLFDEVLLVNTFCSCVFFMCTFSIFMCTFSKLPIYLGMTRDVKRRVETIHKWYGKTASDATATVKNRKRKRKPTVAKTSEDISLAQLAAAKMSTTQQHEQVDSSGQQVTRSQTTGGEPIQHQKQAAASKAPSLTPQKPFASPAIIGASTTQQPSANDIVLSLYDDKYRTVMFQCFKDLHMDKEMARDVAKKRELGIRTVKKFMQDGGRFYKIERGKTYVEVNDGMALQSKCRFVVWCYMMSNDAVLIHVNVILSL